MGSSGKKGQKRITVVGEARAKAQGLTYRVARGWTLRETQERRMRQGSRVKGLHLCEGQVRDKKVTQAFTVGRHWSLVRRPMAQLALCFR